MKKPTYIDTLLHAINLVLKEKELSFQQSMNHLDNINSLLQFIKYVDKEKENILINEKINFINLT